MEGGMSVTIIKDLARAVREQLRGARSVGASNERGAPEPRASYGCGVLANGGRDERSQLMDHWVVATYRIPEEDENARRAFA
jgi:hypothetical protein